jgi:ferredoxin
MLELVSPDLFEREVFMCGPQGFMDAARGILEEMGFDLAKLHSESFGGVRTSVAEKAAPIGGGAADGDDAETGNITVEFADAGITALTNGRDSLLELAEAHDVDLDYGCRSGSCGDCKVKLVSGEVDMTSEEGLETGEREAGYILSCVAHPKGDCVLDA